MTRLTIRYQIDNTIQTKVMTVDGLRKAGKFISDILSKDDSIKVIRIYITNKS